MEISEIQKKLGEGKAIVQCNEDELLYVMKPLGKAIYETALKRKEEREKKIMPKKKITNDIKKKCPMCGKSVRKSNMARHEKTQYHQAYARMNRKVMNLLLSA